MGKVYLSDTPGDHLVRIRTELFIKCLELLHGNVVAAWNLAGCGR